MRREDLGEESRCLLKSRMDDVLHLQGYGNLQEPLTTQENPLDLLDEVTVFIVPTDGMRQRIMQIGQGMLKKARWTPENSAMVPIAVTTFREYEEAKSILTEKIWFRIDDYHLRPTNPILSERQRASPSKSRRR